jgi:tellurite resistance protein
MQSKLSNKNLTEYLNCIVDELNSKLVVERVFGEVALFLPTYTSDGVLHRDDIGYLVSFINKFGLRTEPKLSKGFIERGIGTPLIFYMEKGEINFNSQSFKYARIVVQVAVVMAKTDKEVDKKESKCIENIILNLKKITSQEKAFLLAKARYLLAIDSIHDEFYGDYVKIALNQQSTIKKLEGLSENAILKLLEVAKEIAVADGRLDYKELSFIQDIYRVLGIHARKAKKDIEEFAKSKYMLLKDTSVETIDNQIFDELDDIVGDLLLEFDEF